MRAGNGIYFQDGIIDLQPCGDGQMLVYRDAGGWECEDACTTVVEQVVTKETETLVHQAKLTDSDYGGIIFIAAAISALVTIIARRFEV